MRWLELTGEFLRRSERQVRGPRGPMWVSDFSKESSAIQLPAIPRFYFTCDSCKCLYNLLSLIYLKNHSFLVRTIVSFD